MNVKQSTKEAWIVRFAQGKTAGCGGMEDARRTAKGRAHLFCRVELARIGGLLDVSTYRITGVTFGQKLSGRMFNFGNIIFQTNHGNIRWLGIKDPLNVRRLIEEKVATFQDLGANQATYNEAIIKKVAEVRTEESFGLVSPKHDVSIQDKVGGSSLLQTPSASRYCSNCGRQNPAEAAHCSQCGKQLH